MSRDRRREPAHVEVWDGVAKTIGGVFVGVVGLAMLIPAAVVIMQSFSNEAYFESVPSSWGWRQYQTLLEEPRWMDALSLSVRLGIVVALLSVAIALPAALAISRSNLPGRQVIYGAGVVSIVIPIAAFAVALYGVLSQVELLGTWVGIVLSHLTLSVPLTMLVIASALSRLSPDLELAAIVAGASRGWAWATVTIPILLPAILVGFLLAFVTSLDEAVFINFLGGVGMETLPRAILNSVRTGVDPVITALATILILGTSILTLGVALLSRRGPNR